jgi:hypothetical protein
VPDGGGDDEDACPPCDGSAGSGAGDDGDAGAGGACALGGVALGAGVGVVGVLVLALGLALGGSVATAFVARPAFMSSAPAVASPASNNKITAIASVGARAGTRIDASLGSKMRGDGGSTAVCVPGAIAAGDAATTTGSMRAPQTPQNRDPSSFGLPQRAQLVVTP